MRLHWYIIIKYFYIWTVNIKIMLKEIKYVTAQEAVKAVKSGDHIHLSSVASAPKLLIDALCARGEAGELKDVRIHHLHTEGEAPYADPKFDGVFFHQGFFIASYLGD